MCEADMKFKWTTVIGMAYNSNIIYVEQSYLIGREIVKQETTLDEELWHSVDPGSLVWSVGPPVFLKCLAESKLGRFSDSLLNRRPIIPFQRRGWRRCHAFWQFFHHTVTYL